MSKKSITIFGIVIIILLIVAFIMIFHKEKKDRVANMYEKLRNTQNFTFSMEEQNSEIKYKVSMAQRSTDVSIDMYSDDEHTTTLVLENQAYFINHNDEEYYDYGNEEIESDIVLSGLHNITKNEYQSGREEINGKSYYYEEYNNESTDFIIFADADETSTVKTRFYFDGDSIVFIKNIVTSDGGSQEELIKTNLTFEIDESLFEIPEEYAEVKD